MQAVNLLNSLLFAESLAEWRMRRGTKMAA
jgi:hypothetical protein